MIGVNFEQSICWKPIEGWKARLIESRQKEFEDQLESAIADIQLLGTAKQVDLALKFAIDMAENGVAHMDDLLRDLRDSLRSELKLEPLTKGNRVLRFYEKGSVGPMVGGKATVQNKAPL